MLNEFPLLSGEETHSENKLGESGSGPDKVSWSWAAPFAHNPLRSQSEPRPLRGHLQERETRDQTACQMHSDMQGRTQAVTSSTRKASKGVNLSHTLHVAGTCGLDT